MYFRPLNAVRTLRGFAMLAVLAGMLLAAAAIPAEESSSKIVGPFFGTALSHDVSPPLRLIGFHTPANPTRTPIERTMPPSPRTFPDNVTTGPDPLRQSQERPYPEASVSPLPDMNFEGLSNVDFVLPPDTNGDVGVDYYVQMINLSFAIFEKATGNIAPGGGPFSGDSLWSGFGGPCEDNNDGDPVVLYDHLAGRWLLTQFSIDEGIECVALSQTGDPLGAYDRWAFHVTPGGFNDYPKLGVMPNAYYMSTRDFPALTGNFAGFTALDRTAMLAGDAGAGFVKFGLICDLMNNDCPDGVQPPHLEGPAPPTEVPGFFTKVWDDDFEGPIVGGTGLDGYRIWEFIPDFATPGDSTFAELPIVPAGADFNANMCGGSRDCIPQPDSSPRCVNFGLDCATLDAITTLQMYRAQYRNFGSYDSLLISNTVDATGTDVAGIRWAEMRNPDPAGAGAWTVFQDGTYAPADGENRWMGSIAMDASGNVALGYSVSSENTFPSIRYVTREVGDPPGTLPGGEVELIAGSGTQTSNSHRWGDYSSMSVDPVDGCTFWYTQEYVETTGGAPWQTRIGSFKVPSCVSTPHIFSDGFESGDVTGWSNTVP